MVQSSAVLATAQGSSPEVFLYITDNTPGRERH